MTFTGVMTQLWFELNLTQDLTEELSKDDDNLLHQAHYVVPAKSMTCSFQTQGLSPEQEAMFV